MTSGRRILVFFAMACVSLLINRSSALAQHPDVSPRLDNGQIVTDGFDDDTGSIIPNIRVFNFVLGEDDPMQPYFTGDPGFHSVPDDDLPVGSKLRFDILPGASGLPATLSYWDGNGSPTFGDVPDGESLTLKLGVLQATATGANTGATGFTIGTYTSGDPPLHVHLSSFLNGDAGADPTAGIYLLSLKLSNDSPGIAPSNPIFILYDNGLSDTQLEIAIDYAQATLVPEPPGHVLAGLSLLSMGVALIGRRARNARAAPQLAVGGWRWRSLADVAAVAVYAAVSICARWPQLRHRLSDRMIAAERLARCVRVFAA